MRKAVSVLHLGLAWITFIAVLAEFFFAGLGVFQASSFQIHMVTGYIIGLASVLMLIVALAGWLGRTRILLSALFIVLMFIQMSLVHSTPLVGALHPLNAVAVLYVAYRLVRKGASIGQRSA